MNPSLPAGLRVYLWACDWAQVTGNCFRNDVLFEIKRCLFHGRKAITNLDRVLKSRDVTLPAKVCIPVIMYGCERWTMEKVDTEELMLWDYGAGEDS